MAAVPSHLARPPIATVRAFASAGGAERVVLIVDRGEHRDALMFDCDGLGAVEVTEDGEDRSSSRRRRPARRRARCPSCARRRRARSPSTPRPVSSRPRSG